MAPNYANIALLGAFAPCLGIIGQPEAAGRPESTSWDFLPAMARSRPACVPDEGRKKGECRHGNANTDQTETGSDRRS